ncbi:hypothetical protein AABB24_002943 [Solanum stoloniferum]|uniref:Uncharacterized protein n=1 Tax=Solanum stoloniferum TaxID=62892 RepID=A0ABD2V601_9SOLN
MHKGLTSTRRTLEWHTKDQCYKLIGYPPDFKSKRKVINGPDSAAYMMMNDENNEKNDGYRGMSGGSTLNYGFNTNGAYKGKHVSSQAGQNSEMDEYANHLQGCTFTKSQYSQILEMLKQTQSSGNIYEGVIQANASGSLHWLGEGDW